MLTSNATYLVKTFHFNNAKLRQHYQRIKATPNVETGVNGVNRSTKYFTLVQVIERATNSVVATGTAICNKTDVPYRKKGLELAMERAQFALEDIPECSNLPY